MAKVQAPSSCLSSSRQEASISKSTVRRHRPLGHDAWRRGGELHVSDEPRFGRVRGARHDQHEHAGRRWVAVGWQRVGLPSPLVPQQGQRSTAPA